jgi:xylulokinase
VALNTRWMMEPFSRLLGRPGDGPIAAVGGGAQSDVWCQIIADVTGRPIRQASQPIQANAIGAALIAAVGMGVTTFDELRAVRRERRVFEPSRALRRLYDDQFATFKEVHARLRPLYRRLNSQDGRSS